jgi:hypothetical protein
LKAEINNTTQGDVMTEDEIKREAILPEGFDIDKRGLWQLRVVYDKRASAVRISRVYLSFAPMWLVSNAKCLDTCDGHLVIRYLDEGVVREQIMERRLLYRGSIGGALGGKYDFPLWPDEAKNFGGYLLRADKQCLKTVNYRTVTGWIDTDDGKRFALYGDNGVLLKPSDGGMQQKLEACRSLGDRELFLDTVFKAMNANELACVPFIGSIAAPLLSRLGAPSMIIDIHGLSSTGKTVSAAMAMAVFGNPLWLETKWDGPPGGLEEVLSFFSDMPVYFDEAQSQSRPHIIMETIYNAANGVGTLRGKPQGGTQATRRRTNLVFSTSEAGLVSISGKEYSGIDARILPVEGAPLGNFSKEEVEHLDSVIRKNYGLVGKDLISYLESAADFEKIKKQHDVYIGALLEHVKSNDRIQGRKASTYATLLCAVDVLAALYPNYGDDVEKVRDHLMAYWKRLCRSRGGGGSAHRAYRALIDYYIQNKQGFNDAIRPVGAIYAGNFGGLNPSKQKLIGFLEKTWNSVLKNARCAPDDIVRQFSHRGWILYKKSPKWGKIDHRVRTKVNGVETTLIVLSQSGRDAYENGWSDE